MALKKTRNLRGTTVAITNAYCRVKALRFDHPNRVWVEVGVYENDESPVVLDTVQYEMTVEDFAGKENISAANAYALLKQRDEWKDAADA